MGVAGQHLNHPEAMDLLLDVDGREVRRIAKLSGPNSVPWQAGSAGGVREKSTQIGAEITASGITPGSDQIDRIPRLEHFLLVRHAD